VKALRPDIRVIGVQPVDSDAMTQSLRAGRRVKLANVGLFADGVAVKQVGAETFRLARKVVDDMILVDSDAICAAIKDVFEDTRTVLEPAGALAVAGAKAWVSAIAPAARRTLAIACGANMNFNRLRFVAEQAEMGERREAVFAVTIPERAGSFRRLCSLIGKRNVTEFNYRYADTDQAHVFVGMQVEGREESRQLVRALNQGGMKAVDFSDNEMAKLHVRHMVGGRAPAVRTRAALPLRVPRAARGAHAIPRCDEPRLEHHAVPLPQPRRRLRPRARRHPGAARDARAAPAASAGAALPLHRGDRQSRLSHVPRQLRW
jgi:threonine dehydratase